MKVHVLSARDRTPHRPRPSRSTAVRLLCAVLIILMLASLITLAPAISGRQEAEAEGKVKLALEIAHVSFVIYEMAAFGGEIAHEQIVPDPDEELLEQVEKQGELIDEVQAGLDQIQQDLADMFQTLNLYDSMQNAWNTIPNLQNWYNKLNYDIADKSHGEVSEEFIEEWAHDVLDSDNIGVDIAQWYTALVKGGVGNDQDPVLLQMRDFALDEINGNTVQSDFSTTVETTNGVGIVAERPMYFNYNGVWAGGSCQSGVLSPAQTFYFAEGTVRPDFHSYICIQNPATEVADVRITYMKGDGTAAEQNMLIPARSRGTVNVNAFFGAADGPAADFSAKVETTNGVGIVAERPMYFNYNGTWTGGHVNAGMTDTATSLLFAEGTTRPGFDSYLCIQNPDERDADVLITYMKGDKSNQQQALTVPAKTRFTVRVNDVIGQEASVACDFSARVETTNGVGIVAERPMYFNYNGTWAGGHVNSGVAAASPVQYFAEGTARPGFDSYICIQNPGGEAADIAITYMKGDGGTDTQTFSVAPNSRYTVAVDDKLGEGNDLAHDFSAEVKCTNGQQIVAERPVYFCYGGNWADGHVESGLAGPAGKFYFAEGTRRPGFATYLCIVNPADREADVRITYLKGDGRSQVQQVEIAPRTRLTINCSQTVQGTSLLSAYEDNLETLFWNSWLYQLMATECVCFARDYDPVTYGSSDDYRSKYYERYVQQETEMFLACTEQLVMSQVDVSGLGRSQKGIFNFPADAKQVFARADELAQIALGEGVPTTDADGVMTNLNLGLCGRMIASRDIVPANSTPPALRARLHGGSTTYNASVTELIPLPWLSQTHTLLSYDCWTGAAPYNTLTLDNMWSMVRYRFDNLPKGTYDILDAGGNVVSSGTVTESPATNPNDPSETYSLTYGEFDPIANTRGGPAILLDSTRWPGSSSKSGSLREMDDPNHYHSVIDATKGGLGLWLYATGGDHYTSYTYDQENRLQRTITAGADMDICPHYNFVPKVCLTDINGKHYDDPHGFVQGDITILPSHYTITASYELGVTDLSTGVYTKLSGDSVTCQEELTKYDSKKSFDYDAKAGTNTYHMIAGHQYKFTFKLNGHHYLNTQDNSNMWAILNQMVLLDGMRILGF